MVARAGAWPAITRFVFAPNMAANMLMPESAIGTTLVTGLCQTGRQQFWALDRRFEPGARDEAGHARWCRAVERSKGWARE